MHARQARAGKGGCPVEEGTVDFAGIVSDLKRRQWSGVIAMEFFGGVKGKPPAQDAVLQNAALAQEIQTPIADADPAGETT
jgi:sugar phosphate isomerase/epimerase